MLNAGLLATGMLRWIVILGSALACYRMLRRCTELPLVRLLAFSLTSGSILAITELARVYLASQRSLLRAEEAERAGQIATVVARHIDVEIQRLPLLVLVNAGGFFLLGICIAVFVSVRQRRDAARSTPRGVDIDT